MGSLLFPLSKYALRGVRNDLTELLERCRRRQRPLPKSALLYDGRRLGPFFGDARAA